jgi:hypothetical protein
VKICRKSGIGSGAIPNEFTSAYRHGEDDGCQR